LNKRITLSKKELEELYIKQRLGATKIANIKNISCNVVERELKRHGFALRNKSEADTKYFITKELLKEKLKTKNQKQTSIELGCDASLISFYKKKYEL